MRKVQLFRVAVVSALIVTVGGHWGILQCVAWSTMLIRFATTLPLVQAIQYTFDGEHPCPLCKSIQQGSTKEKKEERQQANSGRKIELLGLIWQEVPCEYFADHLFVPAFEFHGFPRAEEPPTPVPRSILPGDQGTRS